jgi:hypothetical protein
VSDDATDDPVSNICAGGGQRTPALLNYLNQHDPETVTARCILFMNQNKEIGVWIADPSTPQNRSRPRDAPQSWSSAAATAASS